MNTEKYKKPSLEVFEKLVHAKGGNLTKVAEVLRCDRSQIWRWQKADPEFDRVVRNERAMLFDESLSTARLVALGLAAYEDVLDDEGNPLRDKDGKKMKRFAGWIEKPDANMLRYFMSTLGKNEGFGEAALNDDGTVKEGVSIKAWIVKQNEGDTPEGSL